MSKRSLVSAAALLAFSLAVIAACRAGAAPPPDELARGGYCGGFAGFPCDDGYVCVDVPGDGCDPLHGGADCDGVCVPDGCGCEEPGRRYVSRDPEECKVVFFLCEEGFTPFFDECGCGCEPAPPDAP